MNLQSKEWGEQPMSKGQISFLKKWKIKTDHLNRGQASDIITAIIKRSKDGYGKDSAKHVVVPLPPQKSWGKSRTSYRRTRKLTVGEAIKSPSELVEAADKGTWIFFGHLPYRRAYHPSWIMNMNFACVWSYIKHGQLALAKRNTEWPYVFRAEFNESHVPDNTREWWVTCSEIPYSGFRAFTKDSVCRQAEAIASKHAGHPACVQVKFEMPEAETKRIAGLLT